MALWQTVAVAALFILLQATEGKRVIKSELNLARSRSRKIAGGHDATPGQFPSLVSLRDPGNDHFCAGTYIGDSPGPSGVSYILTAAHCIFAFPEHIIVGAYNYTGDDGQIYYSSFAITHPDYFGEEVVTNDIALIALRTKLTGFEPATLAQPGNPYETEGLNVTVVGWGETTEDGSAPEVLQEVDVPITSSSLCTSVYEETVDMDLDFCAGVAEGGLDSCPGDSGGPAYASSDKNVIVGIVSRGYGCARPDIPGVYTRVSAFYSWIQGYLNDLEPTPRPVPSGCNPTFPAFIGNGGCDPDSEYNNAACNWDGGDCCAQTCFPSALNCNMDFALCLDPLYAGSQNDSCIVSHPSFIGDGDCDGGRYNTAACNWDGGDCCKESCVPNEYYCNHFQCRDPRYSSRSESRLFKLLEKVYEIIVD